VIRRATAANPVTNFLALGASEIVARAIGFLATALLARRLGVAAFGVLGFAAAVSGYFGAALTAGFGDIGAREVARSPAEARRIAADGTLARLLIAACGAVGVVVFSSFVGDPAARIVLLLSMLSLFSQALDTGWVYRGLGRNRVMGAGLIAAQLILLAGVVFFVRAPQNVIRVPVVQFVGELIGALLLLGLLFGGASLRASVGGAVRLLRQAGAATVSRLLRTVIVTFDIVLLGFLATRRDVGLYSAAYRVCYLLIVLAVTTHVVYIPAMNRAVAAGNSQVTAVLTRSLTLTAAVLLPLVAGGIALAGPLLGLLFGGPYADGATALRILLLSIAFLAFHGTAHSLYVAMHRTRLEAAIFGAGAALNVVLNFILIPEMGLVGAAWATLAAEVLILTGSAFALVRAGIRPALGRLAAPMLASLAMGSGLFFFSRAAPAVILIFAGGIAYVGMLFASGWIAACLRDAAVDAADFTSETFVAV
jgi:O-antigen/teichoic acid export membrane protein